MPCHICETRKARRYCPGVRAQICSLCCGQEREETIDCPFECEYLQEARLRDKLPEVSPEDLPNKEIRVTEKFLEGHEHLLLFVSAALLQVTLETPGARDSDVRECLDALIQTYKTLESGIYFDTKPANRIAAAIYERMQAETSKYRDEMKEKSGMSSIRDLDVMGMLVFLQRLERQNSNGRTRGKAFIDFLRHYFADFQASRAQGKLPHPIG